MSFSEKREITLKEYLSIPPRNGVYKSAKFQGSGVQLVKMGDLFANKIVRSNCDNYIQLTEIEEERFLLKKGDLLFSRTSLVLNGVGRCSIVGDLSEKTAFESNLFRIRLDSDRISPKYVQYYFDTYLGRMTIQSIAKQTAAASITAKDLISIPIEMHQFEEQLQIVEVLSSIDKKIEINNRINKNLENIAQAIFKQWFVDYDFPSQDGLPYKSSGGKMVESCRGMIPEGWDIGIIGDIATNIKNTIKPSDITEGDNYIGLEHMPRKVMSLNSWGSGDEISSNKYKFKSGDILFGKLRPYFHKVGIAPINGICSTDILVVRPNQSKWYGFLANQVFREEFVEFTNAVSTGTKMPRTNWKNMSGYEIVLPNDDILRAFNKIFMSISERFIISTMENESLCNMRNILLPKLMSGEITIDELKGVV